MHTAIASVMATYALIGLSRTRSVIRALTIQVSMNAIKPKPNPVARAATRSER